MGSPMKNSDLCALRFCNHNGVVVVIALLVHADHCKSVQGIEFVEISVLGLQREEFVGISNICSF